MHVITLCGDKVTIHARFMYCSHTVHGTHNHFIQEKNIKNGSHGIIHIFKNYFATMFLVFNKINYIQTDPRTTPPRYMVL